MLKATQLKEIGDDMQKKGHQTSLVIVIMGLNVGVHSPAIILFHPYRVTLNYDDHVRPKQKMLIKRWSVAESFTIFVNDDYIH